MNKVSADKAKVDASETGRMNKCLVCVKMYFVQDSSLGNISNGCCLKLYAPTCLKMSPIKQDTQTKLTASSWKCLYS